MDTGAEVTLQIARFAQERSDAPRSAARWSIVPGGAPLTWARLRDALAALPKPVVVAPLAEPGAIGVWLPSQLDEQGRAWCQLPRGSGEGVVSSAPVAAFLLPHRSDVDESS